jgi:hypothetical protein
MARGKMEKRANGGANLGFEATLWAAADKLRGLMDAALSICHPEQVEGSLGLRRRLGDELRQAEGSWAANADSFHRDPAPSGTDYILANPPFNMSDWGGDLLRDDSGWKPSASETPRRRRARRVSEAKQYGIRNANCRPLPLGLCEFAWVQHFIHHLAPTGLAGFVLANGSMPSNTGGEGDIRKAIIEIGNSQKGNHVN